MQCENPFYCTTTIRQVREVLENEPIPEDPAEKQQYMMKRYQEIVLDVRRSGQCKTCNIPGHTEEMESCAALLRPYLEDRKIRTAL